MPNQLLLSYQESDRYYLLCLSNLYYDEQLLGLTFHVDQVLKQRLVKPCHTCLQLIHTTKAILPIHGLVL